MFHAHTAQVTVRCELLENSKTKEANPAFLKDRDGSSSALHLPNHAIEQMDAFPELSRFAIRDMGKTVAQASA